MKLSLQMSLAVFLLLAIACPVHSMEMALSDIMKLIDAEFAQAPADSKTNLCSLPAHVLEHIAYKFKACHYGCKCKHCGISEPLLTWQDISAVQQACRYLNKQFHAPKKTIIVDISNKQKWGYTTAEALFDHLLDHLRKISLYPHANKIVLNLVHLPSEGPSQQLLLDKLFTTIDELGLSGRISKLNLSGNQLTQIPDSLKKLTKLSELDLSNNQLQTIPEAILGLTDLVKLNLTHNAIPEQEIAKLKCLPKIEELGLQSLELRHIPDAVYTFSHLADLDLSYNEIEDSELIKLCTIQTLESLTLAKLNSQGLRTIPAEIKNLQKLRSLDVSNNRLSSFEIEKICCLLNLESLSVDDNSLTTLPVELVNLCNLKLVSAYHNNFDADAFATILSLLPYDCAMLGESPQVHE